MTGLRSVALPMYLSNRAALLSLWEVLHRRLLDAGCQGVPDSLEWPQDYPAHWRDPHLLLSQTCGYPLTHTLAGAVQLVGAFSYRAAGCEGIFCRSQLVARAEHAGHGLADFRGMRAAFNSDDAQSGYNAMRAAVQNNGRVGTTHGHTGVLHNRRHRRSPTSRAARGTLTTHAAAHGASTAISCTSLWHVDPMKTAQRRDAWPYEPLLSVNGEPSDVVNGGGATDGAAGMLLMPRVVHAVRRSRVALILAIVAGWIATTLVLAAIAYAADDGASPYAVYFYNVFTVRDCPASARRRASHGRLRGGGGAADRRSVRRTRRRFPTSTTSWASLLWRRRMARTPSAPGAWHSTWSPSCGGWWRSRC